MATGHFDYINSKRIPYPNREYVESFTGLVGGVNTYDQPFNLKSNEAAMMKNLSWRAGVLGCRRGQVLKEQLSLDNGEKVISCAEFLFNGWMIIQTNTKFRFYKAQLNGASAEKPISSVSEFRFVPQTHNVGVFFQYREDVLFKSKGAYYKFSWNSSLDTISGYELSGYGGHGYVPTIQIDTNPATGAGNPYQQENRLSAYKRVVFIPTPAGTTEFHLPVQNIDEDLDNSTVRVAVDGTVVSSGYSVNYTTGVITFDSAPATDSTVSITYRKENPDAYGTLMDSTVAIVFGGAQDLCVVMGGPNGQPNAYFWSGNDGTVMNPSYFPINQYNLAGDNEDPITAFGKQQNMLAVFQTNATGRAVFGTETIGGLVQVTMNYTRINAEIGCDLPGSLQLVQNNLVWANRKYGVCRLKDSSAAYENNITVLSRKINGGRYNFPGLLEGIANIESADDVRSTDTGTRYILTVGTDAYEWNYELSSHEDPSWFLHTHIYGVGFVPLANDVLYEVTTDGKIATFEDGVFADFGEAIEKQYRFPPRNFGTYDRLKNIMSAIFTVRADTNQNTQITYICDYAQRYDPTNMVVIATDEDSGRPFAIPFRRKPGYHNIKHLQTVLYNNEVGKDLSIIDATIFYTLRGRLR